jgi:predicted permease
MSALAHDVRFALRLLGRTPVVTAVAVLSLGLGIGANATIFSMVNEVFLRPIALEAPDRLVSVYTTDERNQGGALGDLAPVSPLNYRDYRDQNAVFSSLASSTFATLSLSTGQGDPEQVAGEVVSGNYFDTLGAAMHAGVPFGPKDDAVPGASPVVVLSYGLWQRRYGGDLGLVGRTITINGLPFTVAAVASESFRGTNAFGGGALWVPAAMHGQVTSGFIGDNWDSRRALIFNVTGRLKPGVTVEQAAANLTPIATSLSSAYPNDNRGRGVRLLPLTETTINPAFRGAFVAAGTMLMVIVGLVLLIACANVANLLMVRAAGRRQEVAVRVSLGAGRGRLIRQLVVESLVLSSAGGGAGLVIALWARAGVQAMRPPFLPDDALLMAMDGTVLAFTAIVAFGTGLAFGLVPAMQFSRPDLAIDLKERASQTGGRRRALLRNGLVVGQLALSIIALVAAGLFLRSLGQARRIDPGFDHDRLAVISFNMASLGVTGEAAVPRQRALLERVRATPGVERATLATVTPLAGGGFLRSVFPEGQDAADPRAGRFTQVNAVADDYFETLGVPILRGRRFTAADAASAPAVAIVNETMAARFWPDQDALGKRFKFFGQDRFTEVVGIARDSKYNFIAEGPTPFTYQPYAQAADPGVTLHVRSANPDATLSVVRGVVRQVEPTMPLVAVFTMASILEQALWAPRMGAILLGVFGGLALVLAAIGVYGVMSYAVAQRTREMGIRVALGATTGNVRQLVLRQGLVIVALGLFLGLAGAVAVSRFVVTLLVNVQALDPVTFVAVPALLFSVAVAAIYLPARRASRVDPVIALRA